MGKRELLLAGVFILVGVVVYQLTAPPGKESSTGFSFGKMVNEIRREVRGQRETAEATTSRSIPVTEAVTEVRIAMRIGAITITGEDRPDIQADFHVRSTGYDTAEAEQLVKESQLLVDDAGALIILTTKFPVAGRQTPTLTLRLPRRLAVRIDEKNGTLNVDGVASVTLGGGVGASTITNIAGQVTVSHRGRGVKIENVGALRLTTTSGDATVSNVRGDAAMNLQSTTLVAGALGGGLELESRNSDIRLEKLEALKGSVRLNLTAGELVMTGLATEARIDGRRTEIRVEMAAAVPLAIYNDSEPIEVQLPGKGVRVDAVASDGRVSLDPALQKSGLAVEASDGAQGVPREERVTGTISGGGAVVTLRNTRADIVLRSGERSKDEGRRTKEG